MSKESFLNQKQINEAVGAAIFPEPAFQTCKRVSENMMDTDSILEQVKEAERIGDFEAIHRLIDQCDADISPTLSNEELMAMSLAEKSGFHVQKDDLGNLLLMVDPVDRDDELADKLVSFYLEAIKEIRGE